MSGIELFDYADSRLGTAISSDYPSTTNHSVSNLISKQRTVHSAPSLLPVSLGQFQQAKGFMAESFVKPPVEVTLEFAHQVSLAAIVVDPRIRQHAARVVSVFTWNSRQDKWEMLGPQLVWEKNDHMAALPQALYNGELGWQQVAETMRRRQQQGQCAAALVSKWQAFTQRPNSLHTVGRIKIRITSMHHAQPPGLGGILIWAQPSQWLPMDLRVQAWESARQCNVAELKQAELKQAEHRVAGSSLGECPGEFIDFITQNIMVDPVVLPGGARCDRSTIRRHLGTLQTDPFTGLPMEYGQAKPDLALQQRIQRWGEKQAK